MEPEPVASVVPTVAAVAHVRPPSSERRKRALLENTPRSTPNATTVFWKCCFLLLII
jgi:hypothetical protein